MALKDFIKGRKSIAFILLVGIVSFACLWAFLSASVMTAPFKSKIISQTYNNKEANIENLLVTETKDGSKLWELFAEDGRYSDFDNVVFLEDIIGNFYQNGKVKASFKADRGTYHTTKKEIILHQNVLLVYEDGTNISADRIEYRGKDTDIIANGNVRIEKPGEAVIMGNKGVLTKDYSDFHIEGRTKTQFYM